ncbi:MAG: DinB family protein [Planctomycetota bacterium]
MSVTTSQWADAAAVAVGATSSPTAADIADYDTQLLVARFRFGIEVVDPRVFELEDEQLDQAFLPEAGVGRWPVRVLLGHLADAELAFHHRIRRTLAEDRPVIGVWDQNAFIDAGLYGGGYGTDSKPPIAGFIATVHTLRRWTSELLVSLTHDQWCRTALHPEFGQCTVRWFVAIATWHIEHHNRFLQAKLDRMLGPRPEPEPCDNEAPPEGGCGPSCGCVGDAGNGG